MRRLVWLGFLITACGGAAEPKRVAEAAAPSVNAEEASGGAPAVAQRLEIVEGTAFVRVADWAPFDQALTAWLAEVGGRLDGENHQRDAGDVSRVTLQVRVPSARWDELIALIEQQGEVQSMDVRRTDVTEQHADMDARLRNDRATEAQLVELLDRRTGSLEDVLQVGRELARVRGEIEAAEARLRALDGRIAMSSLALTVSVTERWTPAATPGFGEEIVRTLGESVEILGITARAGALAAVAVLPWGLTGLVLLSPLWWFARRRRVAAA
jgi:hypothetical protein